MGVGVQGEAGGVVSRHAGDGFDVHTVLQGQGGEGVAQVVEAKFRESCMLQHPVEHVAYTVRRDWPTGGREAAECGPFLWDFFHGPSI